MSHKTSPPQSQATQSEFVPPGTHLLHVPHSGNPNDYYFLMLPHMTMLAFSAAIEPLRVANQAAGKELYRWFSVTDGGLPIRCSNRIEIHPDMALEDVPSSAFIFVCSGVLVQKVINKTMVNWLRRHVIHGGKIGSLCAGVYALAEAGLLNKCTFTMHWENHPAFMEKYPLLRPTLRRYETDNGVLTCGGGNAATDMMLEIVERDHGKEIALYIADMCIHSRSNHRDMLQRTADSAALGSRNPALITALRYMQDNLEEGVRLDDIADRVAISNRQLERLFKKFLGRSPMHFFTELRLSRAHELLNDTNLSISEITAATGFSSSGLLSKKFKARFGVSPYSYQRTWVEGHRETVQSRQGRDLLE